MTQMLKRLYNCFNDVVYIDNSTQVSNKSYHYQVIMEFCKATHHVNIFIMESLFYMPADNSYVIAHKHVSQPETDSLHSRGATPMS